MKAMGDSPSLAEVAIGGGANVFPCASKNRLPITGLSTFGSFKTVLGVLVVVVVTVVVVGAWITVLVMSAVVVVLAGVVIVTALDMSAEVVGVDVVAGVAALEVSAVANVPLGIVPVLTFERLTRLRASLSSNSRRFRTSICW